MLIKPINRKGASRGEFIQKFSSNYNKNHENMSNVSENTKKR